ncbi:Uncharacterized protein PCOAH_00035970 [Plasmodium coatneyi]|uniref:Schizont-infected cell agglutination extracellular alpha domain-containing protein n=1 Tax=Plasmodium coatneyi TaxID=208452 RepID=A0A1B1E1J1_9APIC|nr:Uncharacterized protein PCOAH_00035970 [Plasmodium coatneyi]ANQ08911.1 Uncharacterized protein PCOAH_00035970 [Plasmodium coatneyi]
MNDKVWEELRTIWEELIVELKKSEGNAIKKLCESDPEGEVKIIPWHKPICKTLMKVFLYMNGIKENKKGGWEEGKLEEGKSSMMCIIGTVAMFKLFNEHCWFKDYMEYAPRRIAKLREEEGINQGYGKCAWLDFDSLKIGTELFGGTIVEWIKKEPPVIAEHGNLEQTKGKDWCRNQKVPKKGRRGKNENREKQEWMEKEVVELQGIMKEEKYLSEVMAKVLMEEMSRDGNMNEIMRKLKERLNREIQGKKGGTRVQTKGTGPAPPNSSGGSKCDKIKIDGVSEEELGIG